MMNKMYMGYAGPDSDARPTAFAPPRLGRLGDGGWFQCTSGCTPRLIFLFCIKPGPSCKTLFRAAPCRSRTRLDDNRCSQRMKTVENTNTRITRGASLLVFLERLLTDKQHHGREKLLLTAGDERTRCEGRTEY